MLAINNIDARATVRALEGAERRSALHMFRLGIVGYDAETGEWDKSVAKLREETRAASGFASTGKSAVDRYRGAAPHVARLAETEDDVKTLMQAFTALLMPGNSVRKSGLKKSELAEFADDVAAYVSEGETVKSALDQAREDWKTFAENAPQAGEGRARPNDGTKDDDAAGDPGQMSRGEALTAAVRLLKVAAADLTPTEAALYENLITEAFDLVGDMFAAASQK